ncbi:MAG: formyltransferase family protein, partial [Actinomycetota bacterium]|nr:formyltransferase family protein [Actinomycetota bacterium]
MKKRVVFLGNHTVGVRSLRSLMSICRVELVVAHPPDPEDGRAYESVHDFAMQNEIPVQRSTGRSSGLYSMIKQINPDLIWTTDYRFLLPKDVIELASDACINLHPSLLPAYRGRAPLNWAILNGEREVGLTAHLIDEGADTGAILCQKRISLSPSEDVGDALRRLYPIYELITLE